MQDSDLSILLRNAISEFFFEDHTGATFGPPYLRNDVRVQNDSIPRGLGKSYPAEIKDTVLYIRQTLGELSGEGIRQKLADGSLAKKNANYKGIDCSGFIYIVMESALSQLGVNLADHVGIPKETVVNGALNYEEWRQYNEMSASELESLPDFVSLAWVSGQFHRRQINLCNVAALVSDFSSYSIEDDNCRPGDLIYLRSDMNHCAIVIEADENQLLVAHSSRSDEKALGGISFAHVRKSGGMIHVTDISPVYTLLGIRRLKALQ